MAALFHEPIFATVTASGDKLFFYQTGTTTDLTVYSDSALTTPHAQPVVADSNGEFPAIYIDTAGTTPKIVLKNSDESTTKWTVDPFPIDDLTTVSADLDTAEADIDSLEGRMDTAEADIDVLETESADYETRITALEGEDFTELTDFTTGQLLGSEFSQPLPGGLILKGGSGSISASTANQAITFNTAFPNNIFQFYVVGTTTTSQIEQAGLGTTAPAVDKGYVTNPSGNTVTFRWFAVGN